MQGMFEKKKKNIKMNHLHMKHIFFILFYSVKPLRALCFNVQRKEKKRKKKKTQKAKTSKHISYTISKLMK